MTIPLVYVYVRRRTEGKRTYIQAEDPRGKLFPKMEGTYYLRWNEGGKAKWERVLGGYSEVPAAKQNKQRFLNKLGLAKEYSLPLPRGAISFRDAIAAYLDHRKSKGEDDRELRSRRYDLNSFATHSGVSTLSSVTREAIIRWRDWLLNQRPKNKETLFSPRTVHNKLMTLVCMLNHHKLPRLLEADDWPEYEEDEPQPIEADDFVKMLAVATTSESLCLRLTKGCGLRNGEVEHLTKADIDFKSGLVLIRKKTLTVAGRTKTSRGWLPCIKTKTWSPKFGKGRTIPVADDLLAELKQMPDGLLFPGPDGGTHQHLNDMIQELGRKAGLERRIVFHHLRHTFATAQCAMAANMQELYTVAKWMGHTDRQGKPHLDSLSPYLKWLDDRSEKSRAKANAMSEYGRAKVP